MEDNKQLKSKYQLGFNATGHINFYESKLESDSISAYLLTTNNEIDFKVEKYTEED